VAAHVVATGGGAYLGDEVVERDRPTFVPSHREFVNARFEGRHGPGAERALNRLAHAHEIDGAAQRRQTAVGCPRSESRRGTGHLPIFDCSQTHGPLGGTGIAHQKVVHRRGECLVAHLRRRR